MIFAMKTESLVSFSLSLSLSLSLSRKNIFKSPINATDVYEKISDFGYYKPRTYIKTPKVAEVY